MHRSLLVLRALTHAETGGIVAAATTSLPEAFGGPRNWDYRYSWLRDAALTLEALLAHGYSDEAVAWRDWLLRAVAGDPEDIQIMYGLAGERDLPERELTWLPGYAGSTPVRIGNGAVVQFQGDVIGEVMVALDLARRGGSRTRVTPGRCRTPCSTGPAAPSAGRTRGSGRSAASRAGSPIRR